jgi:hypothetical protein
MKEIRGFIADTLVYWAMKIYHKDDLKLSLIKWIKDNFLRVRK